MTRPAVVFGDEPTGNLDSVSSRELLAHAQGGRRSRPDDRHSHPRPAAATADRVIFLADGRVSGTRERPTIDAILDELRTLAR